MYFNYIYLLLFIFLFACSFFILFDRLIVNFYSFIELSAPDNYEPIIMNVKCVNTQTSHHINTHLSNECEFWDLW